MTKLICDHFKSYNLPRKLVLLSDLSITAAGFLLAYVLRFNFNLDQVSFGQVLIQLCCIILPLYLVAFLWSGSYRSILRHSSIDDAFRFFKAISAASVVALLLVLVARNLHLSKDWILAPSIVIIHAVLSSVMLMGFRLMVRGTYCHYVISRDGLKPVLIFGAGEKGKIAQNVLENDRNSRMNVVGFIDDNRNLNGKMLSGKTIYSEDEAFDKIIKSQKVRQIIMAVSSEQISLDRKKAIFDRCLKNNIAIREVPPLEDWANGQFKSRQIRKIKIEDLLGREPILLNQNKISHGLNGSVVLVTGAAGSIGSEMVRQLMSFDTGLVCLLDQAESALYDLQNELRVKFSEKRFKVLVASVADEHHMRQVFETYRPQYVFHAAAYKHVPLMESFPYEAIRVNVGGTKLLADLSVEFDVKKFVMISTDKAVNPTNVMGASKRICEIYIQSIAQSRQTKTQFITTRFGNVLGSNGSVVPLFRKQIEAGGPVTITHKDIIRYFMTIPEACQLVLEAGFMGRGGEIYVFDMGEPVKIYDLAVKMISLAGLKPHVDIPILITGLRPGEKLFEELLADEENTVATHHPKIKAGKVREQNFEVVRSAIEELLRASQMESEDELVCRMKALVPEFISQNSKFCIHDENRRKEMTRAVG
jgi:FlaA1/EpsC-like NDP-sugar epimerase